MKRNLSILAFTIMASIGLATNVNASPVTFYENLENKTVSYSYTFTNNVVIFPSVFDLGFSPSVKKARIEVAANTGANYQIKLLHNSGGGGYDVNELSSQTLTLDKSEKQVIIFVNQNGTCDSDATMCIKVSPSMPGTSSTQIGVNANQTGLQFVKNGLFGTLKANAKVTYYLK